MLRHLYPGVGVKLQITNLKIRHYKDVAIDFTCKRNVVKLGDDGRAGDAGEAEYFSIAFDLRGGTEGFEKIVGEFDRGAAISIVEFADQADGIEAAIPLRIAVAKIVG